MAMTQVFSHDAIGIGAVEPSPMDQLAIAYAREDVLMRLVRRAEKEGRDKVIERFGYFFMENKARINELEEACIGEQEDK